MGIYYAAVNDERREWLQAPNIKDEAKTIELALARWGPGNYRIINDCSSQDDYYALTYPEGDLPDENSYTKVGDY